MSTANYLRRLVFKWKYAILIFFVISTTAAVLSLKVNRWVPDYVHSFAEVVGQQFQVKISFDTVHYRFPNYLIFKNARIKDMDKKPMLEASRLVMGFSLPLLSSATSLNSMVIEGLSVDLPRLKDYLNRRNKQICAWAQKIPQGRLHLLIPEGVLYPHGRAGQALAFKIDLNRNQDRLTGGGYWIHDGTKLNYELYGFFRPGGFDLGKLVVDDDHSSVNLWGSWHHNHVDWNGFIFYDNFYILDIDGHLRISGQDMVLDRLTFSIDGDMVEARGKCIKQAPLRCDADLSWRRQAGHVDAARPLKNFAVHLHARQKPLGLSTDAEADFYFLSLPGYLQNMRLVFKDLNAISANDSLLKLKATQIQGAFLVGNHQYWVPAQNVLASYNYSKPYLRDVSVSAASFGGRLQSRFVFNTFLLPWEITGQGDFRGMEANRLAYTFSFLKYGHGILSGHFKLKSSKSLTLAGDLKVQRGDLNGSDFQKWLSATLQMPSLEHITAAELSGRFLINGQSRWLDDLVLNSDQISLCGFFHVDADNLVSSDLSARFSKALLEESPVGRHIMGMVPGAWALPFNFSLSGRIGNTNFQWDRSALKDRVHRHMFSFVERIIDRRTDAHPYYNVTTPNESVSP